MDSVEFYPMVALLLFGTFFLGWLVYSIMMPKSDSERFSNIPLDSTDLKEPRHE
jgi:hypothetical protein